MSDQNFDHQIKDSLGDYHSKLDTSALWKQLEPQLAADKKRRRGIFWWWSGAGVFVAFGVWAWFALQNPQLNADGMAVENGAIKQLPETAASGLTSPSPNGTASQTTASPAAPIEQTTQASEESATTTPAQAQAIETQKGLVSRVPKSISKSDPKRSLPKAASSNPITKQAPGQSLVPGIVPDAVSASPIATATDPQSGFRRAENVGFGQQEVANAAINQENTPVSDPGNKALVSEAQPTGLLSLPAWQELTPSLTTRQMPPVLHLDAKKLPKKKAKTDLLLRPNFEIGYALKTLEDFLPDSLPNAHVQIRRETEEALEYLHANLLLGARHHSGWYALTGLGYTSITERFSFITERMERDSIEGITEIYINAQGDSIFSNGLVERTRYFTYRKRTYSSYTLLDVPLIVGYDWEKDRWSFGAEAGVFFNISMKAKGDALDPNADFIRLEDTDWFKPGIGISYYGSLRIGYALDEKTRVSLGPTFRYVPNIAGDPATTGKFKQQYGLFGLNIGIARRF
ncbi:MAG: hypothetical protein HUU01_23630 [Saprospiraceae bacterium]|nr:hypothetical protein [Saprospiraceae bacterium]